MPHLVLKGRKATAAAFPVVRRITLLGRGGEAHVRIDHPSVSRIHARLEETADGWRIEDLESRNGTALNRSALAAAASVRDGDEIRLGEVALIFRAEPAPAGSVATEAPDAESGADASSATRTMAEPATAPAAPPTRRHKAALTTAAVVVLVVLGGVAAWKNRPREGRRGVAPELRMVGAGAPRRADDASAEPARLVDPKRTPATPEMMIVDDDARRSAAPATSTFPDATPTPTSNQGPTTPAAAAVPDLLGASPSDEPASRRVAADAADASPNSRSESDPMRAAPDPPRPATSPPETPPPNPPAPDASGAPKDARAPRRAPTPSERFALRRLSFDLLGRPPTEDELALDAAAGFPAAVDRLVAAPERWDAWFEDELYRCLLIDEFRPGPDRLRDLPGRLAAGRLGVRAALAEIAQSQQFNARNPGGDTYVTVVLEQFLGVVVQKEPHLLAAGKDLYDGRAATLFGKRGRSQADFVDLAFDQPAFAATYVARRLEALLGAPPLRRDVDRYAKRLREEPLAAPAIEREILLSDAWRDALKRPRKKSDRMFVVGLWRDLLGRSPTYPELRNLRNASESLTDPAGLRSLVIGAMLRSDDVPLPEKDATDPGPWIAATFERLLGRPPTQDEAGAFAATWRTPACKPATILHAILTGAEYDHY